MFCFKNRIELSRLFSGCGVEVGVARGYFSAVILNNPSVTLLHSIDPWSRPVDVPIDPAHTHTVEHLEETKQRLKIYGNRSNIMVTTSDEAVCHFNDASLDFVYIDADHTYESVLKDIRIWWHKVKINGVFAGHDYSGNCSGVMRAVDEFFREYSLPLSMTECDEVNFWTVRSWYTIKP